MKNTNREIFFLRSMACLAIVLMHSVTLAFENFNLDMNMMSALDSIRMILMFGTPMFVFISEFVLAYAYSKVIPKGFLVKRLKYILIPFLIMALFYAYVDIWKSNLNFIGFITESLRNIFLAGFHGYFIIIVFQFYLLHIIFVKANIQRFSPKVVITISILINVLYLTFFNFIDLRERLSFIPGINGIWGLLSTLPFFAWVGYFTVAYYCASMYDKFILYLKEHKISLILFTIIAATFMQFLFHSQILDGVHSKRVDVFFYTFSIIFLFFYIATTIKNIPPALIKISQYSFGIYLLHPFFLFVVSILISPRLPFMNLATYILTAFFVSVTCCMCVTYLLNKHKYGKFIVGKLGKGYKVTNEKDLKQAS